MIKKIQHENKRYYKSIKGIIKYIQENYNRDLKIDQMISRSNVSATYFRIIFKDITGNSFLKYLNELRIYHANVIIKNSDLNLNEIAVTVGYTEFQNFHRTFKRVMGYNPSTYSNIVNRICK